MQQDHPSDRFPQPRARCLRTQAKCTAHQVMVPLRDLLTERFLARRTQFSSVESFLVAGGIRPIDLLALDPQSARRWDLFVRTASNYPDWNTMLREAGSEWMIGRLGIVIDA